MSYPVDALEPKVVWKYFDRIRQIPHGSGNEKALGNAIMSWAKANGCEADMDKVGNVVVRIQAKKGCEDAPTVVLQGHLDMVCEKNADKACDFSTDPIVLVRDGDWILADGTTLGADNGIGVAVGLSIMEMPEMRHGPLELLMTVDEETGLNGARSLDPEFVTGRILFNLDSEEDGIFYVGCAGGRDSTISLPLEMVPAPGGIEGYRIEVKGLRGGHSGLDIIHNRGNAVRLLARVLRAISKEGDLYLGSIEGGDKHNAIPREAQAVVLAGAGNKDMIGQIIHSQLEGFREEFASAEPEIALTAESTKPTQQVFAPNSMLQVLNLLLGLPHGVLAMVRDMDGMVETSTNLARARIEDDNVYTVLNSTRSSVPFAIEGVISQIEAVGMAVGAKVEADEGYPGWMPNLESEMLARARKIWKQVHNVEAEFQVVHAGLECGIIGEKYPGMDMISLGPTILNAHSPEEKVSIPDVERFFDFTKAFLDSLTRTSD